MYFPESTICFVAEFRIAISRVFGVSLG